MRKLIANPVARVLPALLAVTALVACAGDDTVSTTGTPSTPETTETTSTPAASATTGTGSSTQAPAATETTTSTVTPPPVGSCDEAAVREAIANADAVAVSYEFTYLKCAEGFGWAEILADFGDQATALFAGSGTDVELLNLGTSVCVPDSGIPADVAAQLAPDPRHPFGDCPEPDLTDVVPPSTGSPDGG
jgi:hypothetical protein